MIRSYAVEGQSCGEGDVRQVQWQVLTMASRKGKCSRYTSSLYWIGRTGVPPCVFSDLEAMKRSHNVNQVQVSCRRSWLCTQPRPSVSRKKWTSHEVPSRRGQCTMTRWLWPTSVSALTILFVRWRGKAGARRIVRLS